MIDATLFALRLALVALAVFAIIGIAIAIYLARIANALSVLIGDSNDAVTVLLRGTEAQERIANALEQAEDDEPEVEYEDTDWAFPPGGASVLDEATTVIPVREEPLESRRLQLAVRRTAEAQPGREVIITGPAPDVQTHDNDDDEGV